MAYWDKSPSHVVPAKYMEAIADNDRIPGRKMKNSEVAEALYEIADLLELQGVTFKPQAYRRAARTIEQLDEPLEDVAESGSLEDLPGVGKAIAAKIEELLDTGELGYLVRLRQEVPSGLVEIMRVPDVGPKTAVLLSKELGINSLEELKRAALEHKIMSVKGMGGKTEERILQGIRMLELEKGRTLLGLALPVADAYVDYLRRSVQVDMIELAGSIRRGRETIGDIDILVGHPESSAIMDSFVSYPEVSEVLMKGSTKSSVSLRSGMQVDIRVVEPGSYGAALQYFTGSKEHNVTMRRLAVEKDLKLNEYGLFERESGGMVAGATEDSIYEALGLEFIPPELREDSGEIEAARTRQIPRLVSLGDIRGDLHVHTEWSDGLGSIEAMAQACSARGYEFMAVTDHSQSLKIANGLTPDRLAKQVKTIRKLDDSSSHEIMILAGCEVDIKPDGSLDLPSSALKDLDIVVGSVHSRFKMTSKEMTDRICSAIESGHVDILGHPTGRLIDERAPYALDLDRVFTVAQEHDVFMEINAFMDRLDLRDVDCRAARAKGVSMAIGTDSHRAEHLGFMRLGVITARRGWLEPKDVLNSLGAKELERRIGGRRP